MNRKQWKTRRNCAVFVGICVIYLLVRVKKYEHKMLIFLPNVNSNEPWEFVADFSNMKYLNPTVIDFVITDEAGNYDHWKYTAEYTEKLSHWPYLPNVAVADFEVKTSPKKEKYFINSVHRTCLFLGLYCLNSESEFTFATNNRTKGSVCEESVTYECPVILSSFCKREVQYQRNAIMNNLRKKFS
ncbi:uncharacterized protein LOC132698302 [Cylas formicarius]|uniref:uncharacterized protein LOC132698302 n=1 Tax=Cylas formicarius TaxID=197179 RepID=UPI002958D3A1|nr:uncharacterized protein LOC132698302 [Cylas formicarius]